MNMNCGGGVSFKHPYIYIYVLQVRGLNRCTHVCADSLFGFAITVYVYSLEGVRLEGYTRIIRIALRIIDCSIHSVSGMALIYLTTIYMC